MNWYKKAKVKDNKAKKTKKLKNVHPTDWVHVDSSFISAIAYDENLGYLEVRMKSGRDYLFDGVPKKVYDNFMDADSKGKFFNEIIKKRYNRQAMNKFNLKRFAQNKVGLRKHAMPLWVDDAIKKLEDPAATPEALAKAMNSRYEIASVAAAHPNTPTELLIEAVKDVDSMVGQAAANNPKMPPEILAEILASGGENIVSEGAAQNVNAPPEALAKVIERGVDSRVAKAAAKNPSTPKETIVRLIRAGDEEYKLAKEAVSNTSAPPEVLEELINKMMGKEKLTIRESFLAQAAVGNPSVSSKLLERIFENDFALRFDVGRFALRNPKMPFTPAVMRKITPLIEEMPLMTSDAAGNVNAPSEFLGRLLTRSPKEMATQAAAKNPSAPSEALGALLEKGNKDTASFLASNNPSAPPDAVRQWRINTGDIEPEWHKMSTAKDPNTPPETLAKIIDDYIELTMEQRQAFREDRRIDRKLPKNAYYIIENLVQNDSVPPEALGRLLISGVTLDSAANNIALKNPRTPARALGYVAKTWPDKSNGLYAAWNPRCPPETIKDILGEYLETGVDTSSSIGAARNKSAPPELLGKIAVKGIEDFTTKDAIDNKNCPSEALVEVAQQENIGFARAAVRHSNFPVNRKTPVEVVSTANISPEVLLAVFKYSQGQVLRGAAVQNPNFPTEKIEEAFAREWSDTDKQSEWLSGLALPETPQSVRNNIIDKWRSSFFDKLEEDSLSEDSSIQAKNVFNLYKSAALPGLP